MPGRTKIVGDWQLIGPLGQGGFGEVHHWRNRATNQEVATKQLRIAESISADQQCKLHDRWQKEFKYTQEFRNFNSIVSGVDLTEDHAEFVNYLNNAHMSNLPVIILEYCNGGDVRKLLQRPENSNGLTEFEVRGILSSLREAIYFLHKNCVICHRDLKPENIVIHQVNGRKLYKLTDFGLARNAPDKTMIQSVVGTRHYYAPEVVDSGKYNEKVDYWSMGVIAYELICGMLPFIPHQKPFNIHVNVLNKPRNCIAITEDPVKADQFKYETNLAAVHHLSDTWSKEITKWLPLALDTDHSRRGATDEVQHAIPAIFAEMDRVLNIKVLTVFSVCSYKRLDYELTPELTMGELRSRITNDIRENEEDSLLYMVLPTGHPHQLSIESQPIDLYVADWCDTSNSKNPPVMVYAINAASKSTLTYTFPSLPPMLQYCLDNSHSKRDILNWAKERMALDLHYVLCREQANIKTLVLGFKEYVMNLEHELLGYQPNMKILEDEKNKCCGAMEHVQDLVKTAQQQRLINLDNNQELQSKYDQITDRYNNIVGSANQIIVHFESALRCIRDKAIRDSAQLYDSMINCDLFNIEKFRKESMPPHGNISCQELSDLTIKFAHAFNVWVTDDRIKRLHKSVSQAHSRFFIIYTSSLKYAMDNLKGLKNQLLQFQLQLLQSNVSLQQPSINQLNHAMSDLKFDTPSGELQSILNGFDSLSTQNVITDSLRIEELLRNDMDIDRF